MQKINFIIFALMLLAAGPVSAARIDLRSSGAPVEGEPLLVRAILVAEGADINAVEGVLEYPSDAASIREIRDGDSVVNFWLERPKATGNTIRFSGIMPGGYSGSERELFSLLLDVKAARDMRFRLSDARALLNDGEGSAISLSLSEKTTIDPSLATDAALSDAGTDKTPPESFAVTLIADETVLDGRVVAVFAAQDKHSGIERYEVAEHRGFRRFGIFDSSLPYEPAESPYLLKDQTGSSHLYVKAIDKAGNARLTVLSPEDLPLYYRLEAWAAILLLLLLAAISYARYKRTR